MSSETNILDLLAGSEPGAVAIGSTQAPPLNYRAPRDQIERTIEVLNDLGIGHGDRVSAESGLPRGRVRLLPGRLESACAAGRARQQLSRDRGRAPAGHPRARGRAHGCPGETSSGRELRSLAGRRLADFRVPRRIVFVDEIPKGATGKLQRIGLAARLGLAPAAACRS
jgi:hypothetical protein